MLDRLLALVAPPLCAACGADAGRACPLCRECRGRLARSALSPAIASAGAVWSAYAYDGPAGAVVRAFKFGGRVGLAETMAAQVVAAAPPGFWDGTLVPVPLHPLRMRRRGFNQSAVFARALARRVRLPVLDCLRRSGDAAPQSGRGRAARIQAPSGAIGLREGAEAPARALLVDDVVTTGATLAACGKALTDAGCAQIGAITYARTLGR